VQTLIIICTMFLASAGVASDQKHPEGGSQRSEPGVMAAGVKSNTDTINSGTPTSIEGVPQIALTFDDGPHPTLTPILLDILARNNARATFYVVGSRVTNHPEIVGRMSKEGHEIGNHTYSHPDLRSLSARQIQSELDKTENAVIQAAGIAPYSTRPPYGGLNRKVINAIPSKARPIVLWTVDPLDWKKPGVNEVARRLLKDAKPGAILLCHDIHEDTVNAMKIVIPQLIQKGYKLVTVSQLLAQRQTLDLDHEE